MSEVVPGAGVGASDEHGSLLVVSNRQPYRHGRGDDDIAVDRPAGGLTAGLDPVMQELGGTWIAWGDGDADPDVVDADGRVSVPPEDPSYTLKRVWLTEEQVDGYYYGFSNQVLWPVCHSALTEVHCEPSFWEAYQEANELFASAVLDQASAGDTIWLQDYHLGLVPALITERLSPSTDLFHFWHIPWPSWDTFRACPYGRTMLKGLLGNDVVGFHTQRYCRNFLECVEAALEDAAVDWRTGAIRYRGRLTRIKAMPMGVPVDRIHDRATSDEGEAFAATFRDQHGIDADIRIVLGVDRLDYMKGIPQRIRALEHLWETRPELQGTFTYVQKASESRSSIPAYSELQTEVEVRVDAVNDRFGADDWTPIVYTTEMLSQAELYGLYREADVALITSLRDGMNLTAQEFAAAQVDDDGVLVLSDQAGVHAILGDRALTVNPNEIGTVADTIEEALAMEPGERRARMERIRERVASTDLTSWMDRCLQAVPRSRPTQRGELRESA
jgi:trehalose 6-phosphate synthase